MEKLKTEGAVFIQAASDLKHPVDVRLNSRLTVEAASVSVEGNIARAILDTPLALSSEGDSLFVVARNIFVKKDITAAGTVLLLGEDDAEVIIITHGADVKAEGFLFIDAVKGSLILDAGSAPKRRTWI